MICKPNGSDADEYLNKCIFKYFEMPRGPPQIFAGVVVGHNNNNNQVDPKKVHFFIIFNDGQSWVLDLEGLQIELAMALQYPMTHTPYACIMMHAISLAKLWKGKVCTNGERRVKRKRNAPY